MNYSKCYLTRVCHRRHEHPADPTSLELFDLIVEQAPSLPLLVIVTFRPEFAAPWIGRSR
jgi:hypothetical protein